MASFEPSLSVATRAKFLGVCQALYQALYVAFGLSLAFCRSQLTLSALPNLLTYARVVAVPLIVLCLFWPENFVMRFWALAIFIAAGITDFFDGYLARKLEVQSSLGRMLDPIADKLLVAACFLMLVNDGTIHGLSLWAAIVILCREILVSGLREYLATLNVSVPVSWLAKWKTTVQLVAIGFLIAGRAGDALIMPGVTALGLVLLWTAALLTLYTGWDYMKAGARHV